MELLGYVRFVILCIILTIGFFLQLSAFLFLRPFGRHGVYAKAIDEVQLFFVEIMMLIMSRSNKGTKVVIHANQEHLEWMTHLLLDDNSDRAVVLSNHLTFLDWIYIWVAAYRLGRAQHLKIILKNSLKHIPVVGWGMRFFNFVFLKRNWVSDQKTLSNAMETLKSKENVPLWLLMFPEGTIINGESYDKTKQFAQKNGITLNTHTLIPKTTGAFYVINSLRNDEHGRRFTHVYNLTIAYEGVFDDEYADDIFHFTRIVASGKQKIVMHIHFSRIRIEDIHQDEEDFKQWLYEEFSKKSEMVKRFTQDKSWPDVFEEVEFKSSLDRIIFCILIATFELIALYLLVKHFLT